MKKFRKNNKGFTLVELIIVIAIIAVLSAVLAPQYIAYVEKSRASMDESVAAEVLHNVEILAVDATIYDKLANGDKVKFTDGAKIVSAAAPNDCPELTAELLKVFPDNIVMKSKTYDGKTYTVTVTVSDAGTISCAGAWS